MTTTRTLGLLALVATGCTDIDSTDLTTGGMWAQVVVADEDGSDRSRVSVVLKAGGALSDTYVELDGDDRLTATLGDETVELDESTFFDLHTYGATFGSAPADRDFVVALERSVDGGAPDTRVQLPEPLTVDGPATLARGAEPLALTWTGPSDDPMAVAIDGDCIERFEQGVDGTLEAFTVPAGSLVDADEDALIPDDCDLTVTVTRVRVGDLDPGYGEGGEARGERVRTLTIASTP